MLLCPVRITEDVMVDVWSADAMQCQQNVMRKDSELAIGLKFESNNATDRLPQPPTSPTMMDHRVD